MKVSDRLKLCGTGAKITDGFGLARWPSFSDHPIGAYKLSQLTQSKAERPATEACFYH